MIRMYSIVRISVNVAIYLVQCFIKKMLIVSLI